VNSTKDLQNDYTDLLMLPSSQNTYLSTSWSNASAAAVGYIYFDDGVKFAQAKSRFDIYLTLTPANNGCNITV